MSDYTIVVNDIAASPGGGLTVLKDFYEAVKNRTEDGEWVFLLSKQYVEESSSIRIVNLPKVKKRINRIMFDSFYGATVINRFNPTVVFSLQNTITAHCKGKTVTYVHQSIPFQKTKSFSFLKKKEFGLACIQHLLGKRIKRSIKNSDLVIVQTKWMKEAIEKQCKVNNVKQIYPNLPSASKRAEYICTKDFFYPTNNAIYKNNELFIQAAKDLIEEGLEIKAFITIEGNEEGVSFLGRIPTEDVYHMYTKTCLVFPSYIETFGYPLVEAKAARALILASDCPFSHELLDGYENAYFFDPFNSSELVDLMRKVATGCIVRKETETVFGDNENNTWNQVIDEILQIASEAKS